MQRPVKYLRIFWGYTFWLHALCVSCAFYAGSQRHHGGRCRARTEYQLAFGLAQQSRA